MDMRRRHALGLIPGTGLGVALSAMSGGARADTIGLPSAKPGGSGLSDGALVTSLPGFSNGYALVNGVCLHYVIGGNGAPLMLLPGWPETWWEFRKVMSALAEHYRVIAVDLRGMGSSGKPQAGYDKKTMAEDIYQLARHLGYEQVNVAGHDIGSMVAFAFAATHPSAATKVAMLDVAFPDEGLYSLSLIPRPGQQPYFLWWLAFNQASTTRTGTRPRSGPATAGTRRLSRTSLTWPRSRSSARRSWPCTPTLMSRARPACCQVCKAWPPM
jgi:pimeloyl-ACP methyl ester carboxylesterase